MKFSAPFSVLPLLAILLLACLVQADDPDSEVSVEAPGDFYRCRNDCFYRYNPRNHCRRNDRRCYYYWQDRLDFCYRRCQRYSGGGGPSYGGPGDGDGGPGNGGPGNGGGGGNGGGNGGGGNGGGGNGGGRN
ncbi:hypothetical protein BGZ99_002069 [Dissophora globulifera]|uniref:Uncharacterized protein n=1 Tax=Dissophora globulifera TaxID=979702 RepID=A0A9P6UJM2_9FUNG|nr:hypothetical protein BGZ99_002069 [Dissophora globulifera]